MIFILVYFYCKGENVNMLKGKLKKVKHTALLLAPTALLAVPLYLIATPIEKASAGVKKLVQKITKKHIEQKHIEQSKQKLEQIENEYSTSPIGKIERSFDMTQDKKCRITTVYTKYGPIKKHEIVYQNAENLQEKRAIIYSGFVCIEENKMPIHITAKKSFCTETYSTGTTRDFVRYHSQIQYLWQTEPFEFEQSTSPDSTSAKHFDDFVKYFDEQYFRAKENLPML